MNKHAVKRILNTIGNYIDSSTYDDYFDGVYINQQVLDLLAEDLKKAIHCDDVCEQKCEEYTEDELVEDDELPFSEDEISDLIEEEGQTISDALKTHKIQNDENTAQVRINYTANIFDGDMPPKEPQSICVVGTTFISPKDKCEYTVDYMSYNEEKGEFTYLVVNNSDWGLPSKKLNGAQLNEIIDTEDGSNIRAYDIGDVVQLISDESRHNEVYHTIKEIIPDFNRCIYLYRFFDIDELYKDDDFNFVREGDTNARK